MSLPIEFLSQPADLPDSPASPAAASLDRADSNWKQQLANATTSVAELLAALRLSDYLETADIDPEFGCLVTDSYIRKIQPGNINDPLLRQVLPINMENQPHTQHGGIADPVGDLRAQVTPGLLHKYHGRVLLISTAACAIHCRYCFRRAYPYQKSSCTSRSTNDAVDYLHQHREVEEVILSGGDPLTLDNEKLAGIISKLESISHVHTLRIHTRLPLVLPDRIDSGLLHILQATRFQVVMVIHANHANELQQDECDKLLRLHGSGVTLLNQSVLLKGVNDDADVLINLSRRLFQCRTLPYYLHLLDPARGAMHFNVPEKAAVALLSRIAERLPGYLVPRLVREVAENRAKTAIFDN